MRWRPISPPPAREAAITAAAAGTGVAVWLRVPLVAGVNDDETTVAALARLARATPGVQRVSLLPYHPLGVGKAVRLGRGGRTRFAPPSPARVEALAAQVAQSGIHVTIGG